MTDIKILVVEDNEDSRCLLVKILRAYGHEVTAATDGAEALERALAQPPDIILSDIMMPKMDGYQLCHECKQNDKLKDIPFVFYTATYTAAEDEKFALKLGANAFIKKPTEPDTFVQMLEGIFEKAKAGLLAPSKVATLKPSLYLTEYNKRLIAKLEDKVTQLEAEITQRKRAEHELNERVKEQQCLYGIANIAGRPGITMDGLYQEVVNLLPQGWQYPEIICARVIFGDKGFKTDNFKATEWVQSASISIKGQKKGTVEVYYLEARPEIDEGTFLKEESLLIKAVAEWLERITERMQAEEALREAHQELQQSEQQYRGLVENINDGYMVVRNQRVVFANQRAAEMIGYALEEGDGKPIQQFLATEVVNELVEKHETRLCGEAVPQQYETQLLRKDGTRLPVELSTKLVLYEDSPAHSILVRDISERKKMEEQLIVTDRLASIGELSSGIAHELNNPLTSVIGFSDLLLDKDLPASIKEDIEIINREAKRTAGVVRNLLTFARKHETEKRPVNINSIIESVLELRAREQKLRNIEVNTRFASDLQEIMADGFRLQQVFLNIIINAEYFMTETHKRGTFTITTERVGDITKASFTDDGPGITEENRGHLFDPFFTTKEAGKGTGLGLSICHGIITEHGGSIYVDSELGKGTTFVVELPINK